jgi:hypothetical protein
MLYKAYFSTFQSLCQVSREEFSARLAFSQSAHSPGFWSNFSRETLLALLFLCQCIHMNTLLPQPWVLSPTPESDLPLVKLCRVRRGSCSLDVGFWGCVVLVCVDLSLCEGTCREERRSSHLPQHETRASHFILCHYVKSNGGCAALDGIWLECGGEMYSPEYIRLYYPPLSTTHPSQPLHIPSSPLPYLR